jgi:hypothetical protein
MHLNLKPINSTFVRLSAALTLSVGGLLHSSTSLQAACDGVPLIVLTTTVSKSPVTPGESVTLTYQVQNPSPELLNNVTISDDNGTPDWPADDVVVAVIPTLAPGDVQQVTRVVFAPSTPGSYTITACAHTTLSSVMFPVPLPVASSSLTALEVTAPPPPPTNPGVLGQGFWKNHPEAWCSDSITLGGASYSKVEAVALLKTPPKRGDKTLNLVHQLIAAKLNVCAGNDASCVQDAIAEADEFLGLFPIGSLVKANSPAWQAIAHAFEVLAAYNEGLLCVPAKE